jgi:hypothetical protein
LNAGVAVPLPLSFPLPPTTLLGLAWLMVGCWMCQCEPNSNDSEYQRCPNNDDQSDDEEHQDEPQSQQKRRSRNNKSISVKCKSNKPSLNSTNGGRTIIRREEPTAGPSRLIHQQQQLQNEVTINNHSAKEIDSDNTLNNHPNSKPDLFLRDEEDTEEEEEIGGGRGKFLSSENQCLLASRPNEDDLFDNNQIHDNNHLQQGPTTGSSIFGNALPFLKKIWKKSIIE